MPRKKREVPMEQGSLRVLFDRFIKPLLPYKPNDCALKDFLEETVFHLKYRDIHQYRAKFSFRMPGLYQESAHRKIQGLGYRAVAEGTHVLVRKDHRDSDYDLEFFGGVGDKDQVFTLSESEWNSIASKLELLNDK